MTVIEAERRAAVEPEPGGRTPTHHRVVIVGAGFAGIGAAIKLKHAGINDFTVLEKADDLGGTWQANTYPGCQCDVPSHLYSFSFAPNPDWSRTFSGQAEIWEYLRRCAAEHGATEKVRLGVELRSASWIEEDQLWRLDTSKGLITAEVLISGMGALSEPSIPEIEGLFNFRGPCFHSARWDHGVSLEGKRVGVIGTGSSAIQIVPEIQPAVASLTLFQRTPPWIIPHPGREISSWERALYKAVPGAQRLVREAIYWGRELYVLPFLRPILTWPGERLAMRHLRRQVEDRELRAKLTPTYKMGCKRILLSNDYYPALQRGNVTVVSEGVARAVPEGVVAAGGELHELDAIVMCTGFHVTDVAFASFIRGRGGNSLEEAWRGSPKAHLGTTVAGFPNLFLLLGPNTTLGHTSVVIMIEAQLEYMVKCIQTMDRLRVRAIEPKAHVQEAFASEMHRRTAGTVWTSGGCGSWYLDRTGRASTIWPGPTWQFRRRLAGFHEDEHILYPRTLPDDAPGRAKEEKGQGGSVK